MTPPRLRRRPGAEEPRPARSLVTAATQRGGGTTGRRGRERLAARQGRAACNPLPHGQAIDFAGAGMLFAPTRLAGNVTRPAPTPYFRGNQYAGSGSGWNRGTAPVPTVTGRKPLILQANSESGTVEPWNRHFTYARAGVRDWLVPRFHGSRGIIHKGYQWIRQARPAVPSRFHGSTNRKRGRN